MILASGLTPAWQGLMVFDGFHVGEVNRAREVCWYGSGKVLNAAVGVHHLGGTVKVLATLGGDPLAQIDRQFAEFGIPRRWIESRSATRVCMTILDRATGEVTELVENGRPLLEEELVRFREAYAEEVSNAKVAILIGSLPQGTPKSFYRELLQVTPCPAVLDFRGEELLGLLDLKPLVVKPNREELAATVGQSLESDAELVEAMQSLNQRGAQWVIITQGKKPVWLSSTDRVYRLFPPEVAKVVNPIGCGDAMAAAVAWAVGEGHEMVDAVRYGIAAATVNLGDQLACRLDREAVCRLAEGIRVEMQG